MGGCVYGRGGSELNTIQEPTGIHNHFEFIGWMNNLLIDLKLQLTGIEPSSPITMERLQEFTAHYTDLMACRKPATTARYDIRTLPRHIDAIGWVADLVYDLMKIVTGYEPGRPVDLERLSEYRPHRQDIEGCITRGDIVY